MPLPPSPPDLTTHDISSSTSFRPLQTLPDLILVSIIAHHPLTMHITPHILPPSPTLTSTLEPSTHPRPSSPTHHLDPREISTSLPPYVRGEPIWPRALVLGILTERDDHYHLHHPPTRDAAMSPSTDTHPPTSTSYPSPPTFVRPDQASPYSILHRIHSRYPLSRYSAP